MEKYLNDCGITRRFDFFITNKLIFTNQSDFKPCINQLLSVIHGIYALLDEGYEVGGVLFNISKALDKVWHESLWNVWQNGISSKLLCLLKDFLSDRKQRVVLNRQCSSWMSKQEFPKVLYLGLYFLFFIYINDLLDNLTSNPKLYVDDTSVFFTITDPNAKENQINNVLHNIDTWAHQWKMNFNPDTSE